MIKKGDVVQYKESDCQDAYVVVEDYGETICAIELIGSGSMKPSWIEVKTRLKVLF